MSDFYGAGQVMEQTQTMEQTQESTQTMGQTWTPERRWTEQAYGEKEIQPLTMEEPEALEEPEGEDRKEQPTRQPRNMDEDERQALMAQRAKELEESFSYDKYQVVRKELFAHQRDPSVIIRRDSVSFNKACIDGLEDTVYVQIMINMEEKKMAVRKCSENDKGALRWCVVRPDKRVSRKMSGRAFTSKLYKDMGWSEDYRYRVLGYRITVEGQTLYIFDLSEAEVFKDQRNSRRKSRKSENSNNENDNSENSNSENSGNSENSTEKETTAAINQAAANAEQLQGTQPARGGWRPGKLPEEWKDSYGPSVEENDTNRQVNLSEGYISVAPENLVSSENSVSSEKKEAEPVGC